MNTKAENKICQNCKQEFLLTAQDFELLEKMNMPAPTFCNDCQMIERMIWRNEKTLYKRVNNAPGTSSEIISIYSPDSPVVVYDTKTWWGDSWDAYSYGKEYDFSRPFFEQYKELLHSVPFPALQNWNVVNSDYGNCCSDNKNCYMSFCCDINEDIMYSFYNMHSKNVAETYWADNSEFCYELVVCEKCYRVKYAMYARECVDSAFLYDCANCSDCTGCVNLRNKKFCILNEQYSKEEYIERLKDLKLDTFSGLQDFAQKFEALKMRTPKRFAYIVKAEHCTGDRILGAKDCINCFDVAGPAQNIKDSFMVGWKAEDVLRCSQVGFGGELIYNSFGVFSATRKVACSIYCPSSMDIYYSQNCPNSSNAFGCIGVKKANYSILNKRYDKKEYEVLVEKIKKHMDEMPYVDKQGRVYRFGDFFPAEFSVFAYNESVAQNLAPQTQEEIENQGYRFYPKVHNTYTATLRAESLPDQTPEDTSSLEAEVISCLNNGETIDCTGAFRYTKTELEFYKRMKLPLPRYCFNCRHQSRFSKINSTKLYISTCGCGGEFSKNGLYKNTISHSHKDGQCTNQFETTYSPDRPEIVYCEKCYQQEVY